MQVTEFFIPPFLCAFQPLFVILISIKTTGNFLDHFIPITFQLSFWSTLIEKSHSNSHDNKRFSAIYFKHGYVFNKKRLPWILASNWLWASDYHLSRLEQLEKRRHENTYGMS